MLEEARDDMKSMDASHIGGKGWSTSINCSLELY